MMSDRIWTEIFFICISLFFLRIKSCDMLPVAAVVFSDARTHSFLKKQLSNLADQVANELHNAKTRTPSGFRLSYTALE